MSTNATTIKPVSKANRTRKVAVKATIIDLEYEAWKRANGLDRPLSREAYVKEFNPCGLV